MRLRVIAIKLKNPLFFSVYLKCNYLKNKNKHTNTVHHGDLQNVVINKIEYVDEIGFKKRFY